MRSEGYWDSAKLRSEGKPSDSTIRKEQVAASTSSGGRVDAWVGDRNTRQRAKTNGKVCHQGIERIRSWNWRRRSRSDIRYQSSDRRGCRGSGKRRYLGHTFQWIVRVEDSGIVGSGSSGAVSEVKLKSDLEMLGDQGMVKTGKAVDVLHHACRSVEDLEKIAEKLLSPTTDLMYRPIVLQNFFNGAAVTKPKEFGAPKKFPILTDSPASTSGFTNKRMEVAFPLGTTARTESNRTQPSAVHSEVEGTDTIGTEQRKGDDGSLRIVGLHQDPAHAGAGPIRLEKTRKRRIITSKTR